MVANKIKDMEVNEEKSNKSDDICEINQRLENMLKFKGIKAANHKLIKVGGGGKCGANCVSIHITGSDKSATEIRTNINRHILENWEVYNECFEYPYSARIGGGTKCFRNEQELMIFLMEEVEEASSMWMTHVCMQAAATMLNMQINILTTGIQQTSIYKCARCQPRREFKSETDLILHNESVHHRIETEEEK